MKQHPQALKDFADWMNQLAGKKIMDEKKLERIMYQAMKQYHKHGTSGFIDYLSQIVGLPISQEAMKDLMRQMLSPEGIEEIVKQMNLSVPAEVNDLLKKQRRK